MTDTTRPLYPPPPPKGAPRGVLYMCFTDDHDLVCAKREFLERHAHEPAFAFVDHRILWVGPIVKGKEDE